MKLEYFEGVGGSTMKLSWSYPGQGDQVIPQVRLYSPDEIFYLSDLPWVSAKGGWGPVEKDRSNGEMPAGDGKTLTIETGKLAGQAGGAVTVRQNDTLLLAAATMAMTPREGPFRRPLRLQRDRLQPGPQVR